jgi:hypothetical protein
MPISPAYLLLFAITLIADITVRVIAARVNSSWQLSDYLAVVLFSIGFPVCFILNCPYTPSKHGSYKYAKAYNWPKAIHLVLALACQPSKKLIKQLRIVFSLGVKFLRNTSTTAKETLKNSNMWLKDKTKPTHGNSLVIRTHHTIF